MPPAKKEPEETSPEVTNVTNEVITHNEPPCSITIKMYSPGGADIMMRICSGATEEHVKEMFDIFAYGAKYANEQYSINFAPEKVPAPEKPSQDTNPAPAAVGMPQPSASAPAPHDSGPLMFHATGMKMEIKDGKKYFKIIGDPPFHLHGLRIWDEVLESAGWAIADLNAYEYQFLNSDGSPMNVTAYYVQKEKNGHMVNDKVTRLDVR